MYMTPLAHHGAYARSDHAPLPRGKDGSSDNTKSGSCL